MAAKEEGSVFPADFVGWFVDLPEEAHVDAGDDGEGAGGDARVGYAEAVLVVEKFDCFGDGFAGWEKVGADKFVGADFGFGDGVWADGGAVLEAEGPAVDHFVHGDVEAVVAAGVWGG